MTTRDFPALGFNPAPGDLGSVDAVTGKLDAAKRPMDSAHAVLSLIGKGDGQWQGEAASAFAENVGDLPKYVSDSRDAMRDAVTQLRSWHTALSSYQSKGRQYESEAAAAKQTVATRKTENERAVQTYNEAAAHPDLRLAGTYYTDQAALDAAQKRIDAASDRLGKADTASTPSAAAWIRQPRSWRASSRRPRSSSVITRTRPVASPIASDAPRRTRRTQGSGRAWATSSPAWDTASKSGVPNMPTC
ncbi:putative T7SS-secreted protein [Streptomyces sp. A1-5]|uniref:putative T7SS-secreted protein n=1 Tax=Streptomyces sp. A1-5 TaxID=2738410 RepID=UPI001F2F61B3|nr:hypothetical protein [Streptomyces sp. A1-5]